MFLEIFLLLSWILAQSNSGYCYRLVQKYNVNLCGSDDCCVIEGVDCVSSGSCSKYADFSCIDANDCDSRCCKKTSYKNEMTNETITYCGPTTSCLYGWQIALIVIIVIVCVIFALTIVVLFCCLCPSCLCYCGFCNKKLINSGIKDDVKEKCSFIRELDDDDDDFVLDQTLSVIKPQIITDSQLKKQDLEKTRNNGGASASSFFCDDFFSSGDSFTYSNNTTSEFNITEIDASVPGDSGGASSEPRGRGFFPGWRGRGRPPSGRGGSRGRGPPSGWGGRGGFSSSRGHNAGAASVWTEDETEAIENKGTATRGGRGGPPSGFFSGRSRRSGRSRAFPSGSFSGRSRAFPRGSFSGRSRRSGRSRGFLSGRGTLSSRGFPSGRGTLASRGFPSGRGTLASRGTFVSGRITYHDPDSDSD